MGEEHFNEDDHTTSDSLLEMADREYKRLYGDDEENDETAEAEETDLNEELPEPQKKEKISSVADLYVITVTCGFILGIFVGFIINRIALCMVLGVLIGCALGVCYYYKKYKPNKLSAAEDTEKSPDTQETVEEEKNE